MKRAINIMVLLAFMVNPILVQFNALKANGFGESANYGKYNAGFVGRVYDDGNSIGYAIGGKYTFKLNKRNPQPWFNGKPPSVSMGCGGISFNGGFISLLNLDQIGEQLKDAGAAFAWGIMLGLVTSLPSIKEVWDTINKWAKMIQSLLANACNMGKKIGKMAKDSNVGKGVTSAFDKVVNSASQDGSLMGTLQESGGEVSKHITGWLASATEWASSPATKTEKEAAIFAMVSGVFDKQGIAHKTVTSLSKEFGLEIPDMLEDTWNIDNADGGEYMFPTTLKSNPSGLSGSELTDYQLKVIVAIFLYNSTNSYVMTDSGETSLVNFLSNASGLITGNKSPEEMDKEVKKFQDKFNKAGAMYTIVAHGGTSSNVAAVMKGWMKNGDSDDLFDDIKAFNLPYISAVVSAPANTSGAGNEKTLFLADSESLSTVGDNADWLNVFKNFGNFSEVAEKQMKCLKRDASVTDCANVLPIIIPQVKEYMYIYSQSLREDQLLVEDKLKAELEGALWDTLVQYVKYECKRLNSRVTKSISAKSGGSTTEEGSGLDEISIENHRKSCEELVKGLEKEADPDKEKVSDKSLDKLMHEMKVKNIQRGLANSPK